MPLMKFDLEDGKPPVSFTLKPQDAERFMVFMDTCNGYKLALDAGMDARTVYQAPPGMKMVPAEDPRVVDDLAALVGRLAHSLKSAKPDSELPAQALDYLKRMRLQGSPLREGGATAAQTDLDAIAQRLADWSQTQTARAIAPGFERNVVRMVLDWAAATPAQPELTVWFGSMPESCGRENWTVMLRRKAAPEGATPHDLHSLLSGFTVCRSEYKDRMRYEADRLRFLLGEIDKQPFILDYDADLHSGYVAPVAAHPLDAMVDALIAAHDAERGRQCDALRQAGAGELDAAEQKRLKREVFTAALRAALAAKGGA